MGVADLGYVVLRHSKFDLLGDDRFDDQFQGNGSFALKGFQQGYRGGSIVVDWRSFSGGNLLRTCR